jgi:hypothetical protein
MNVVSFNSNYYRNREKSICALEVRESRIMKNCHLNQLLC